MSIQNPSQMDCNNMEPGDLVYVRHRSPLYRWYRKHFLKDKPTIKVLQNWVAPPVYDTYYQEDCTLIYKYELECQQVFNNEVPCAISYKQVQRVHKKLRLESLVVGLYNLQIKIDKKWYLTIPMSYIESGIKRNKILLNNDHRGKIMRENLKFQKYKGTTFKNIVQKRNIEQWKPSFCSVCGEPIIFKFTEDGVNIDNKCQCGNNKINISEMDWDLFATWYCGQPDRNVVNYYKKFWFDEGV